MVLKHNNMDQGDNAINKLLLAQALGSEAGHAAPTKEVRHVSVKLQF